MNFIDGFEEASRAPLELACQRTGVLVSWRPWKKTGVVELLEMYECRAPVVRHEGLEEMKLYELLDVCERLERLAKIGTKI